jgi:hypothetical protein
LTTPDRSDVVTLSRYRQRIRRAAFQADDRRDNEAVELLDLMLTAAEELEMATRPTNDADAWDAVPHRGKDTGLAALESRDLVQMCQVFALQHVSSV